MASTLFELAQPRAEPVPIPDFTEIGNLQASQDFLFRSPDHKEPHSLPQTGMHFWQFSALIKLMWAWLYIEPSPILGRWPAGDPVDSDRSAKSLPSSTHPHECCNRRSAPAWAWATQYWTLTVFTSLACSTHLMPIFRILTECETRWGVSSLYHQCPLTTSSFGGVARATGRLDGTTAPC